MANTSFLVRAGIWMTGIRTQIVTCILVLALLSPLLAHQKESIPKAAKPDFSEVKNLIQTQIVARSIPGLSIAVVRRGEILWEEGFGWADQESRIPATEHTRYYLASLSKSITATAIMKLEEKKQIDLDHPINDYLGAARVHSTLWNPSEATVRRVATHTAGLATYDRNCYADQPDCRAGIDETIERYGVLFWRPGDHFDYSNLDYGILGEAIARVSGKSYADFLRDEIFRPLGMTHSSLGLATALNKDAAVRYSFLYGRRPASLTSTPGASSVYSSAHDLALFALFHLKSHLLSQKAILSDELIDAMQNITVPIGNGQRYGLGWWVNDDLFGYRSVLGQGGTDDSSAWLQMIPSENLAVIVLANKGDSLPETIVPEVLSVLLPSFRQKRAAAKNPEKPPDKIPEPPPPALVGNWAGIIRTPKRELPLTFSISTTGDVQAKLGSELNTLLNHARFTSPRLTGVMAGNLGMDEDTGGEPYDLRFELYVRGNTLYGAVTTRPRPGSKHGGLLSYWVELRKEANAN
jgi:CubicO group peptidase (beta-lactamase class C family)